MRILANENFPGDAVAALRREGHDVLWIREGAPGIGDGEVLARGQTEQRILITFDKDFGELAFKSGLAAECGIVLFRLRPASPSYLAKAAVAALKTDCEWAGHFTVVEEHRLRQTPLPGRGNSQMSSLSARQ